MKELWDERFSGDEYMYGIAPNPQFKTFIDNLPKGTLLLPGEGEGRNAVYAAAMGHKVVAIDQSIEGQRKALLLAHRFQTHIDYRVVDLMDSDLIHEPFDAIALVFLHLPLELRGIYHSFLQRCLKPGGKLFVVGFSTEQLKYASGGPNHIDWLYTPQILSNDFMEMEIVRNEQIVVGLSEGFGHQGQASLVVFEAVKK
jgi:SAM-dependent methyltransferase